MQRHRFRVRGWNGALASPVGDLNEALDAVAAEFGPVPVVLVGHSMGARAAVRAAGHPAVSAVAGLAPWLPPGEPAGQLAGRRVLLAHGTADSITSPAETWAFVERARAVTEVAAVEVRDGDQPCCAARAYGTRSRPNSPARRSPCRPVTARWPPR